MDIQFIEKRDTVIGGTMYCFHVDGEEFSVESYDADFLEEYQGVEDEKFQLHNKYRSLNSDERPDIREALFPLVEEMEKQAASA